MLNHKTEKALKINGFPRFKMKGRFKMFGIGKKKNEGVPVQHYEGIEGFASNYPCRLELDADNLTVTRLKPETTVTLPVNRIQSITAMEEPQFMQMYHGNAASTGKNGIKKYFLVIQYDKGMLAFWGTAAEYGKFLKMQTAASAPSHILL